VTRVFAENATAWGIPDSLVPRMAGIEDAMARSLEIARDAGIEIGSGSDILGREQNRRGLELAIRAELGDPMEAIVSATAVNARIIRRADELGTVELGKVADIIAVDFDPLTEPALFDDPDRVRVVVKNGTVVKDTR
jgi:imidazolonepropionase-like amidohydrolase